MALDGKGIRRIPLAGGLIKPDAMHCHKNITMEIKEAPTQLVFCWAALGCSSLPESPALPRAADSAPRPHLQAEPQRQTLARHTLFRFSQADPLNLICASLGLKPFTPCHRGRTSTKSPQVNDAQQQLSSIHFRTNLR
jgi:hypothetical protein